MEVLNRVLIATWQIKCLLAIDVILSLIFFFSQLVIETDESVFTALKNRFHLSSLNNSKPHFSGMDLALAKTISTQSQNEPSFDSHAKFVLFIAHLITKRIFMVDVYSFANTVISKPKWNWSTWLHSHRYKNRMHLQHKRHPNDVLCPINCIFMK